MPPAPMLLAGLGPAEVLIILLVLVLLFGAKKLPELARGSGRALRILKAEIRGMVEEDDDDAYRKHAPSRFDAAREQPDGERPPPQHRRLTAGTGTQRSTRHIAARCLGTAPESTKTERQPLARELLGSQH